jgi:hypothetical protein
MVFTQHGPFYSFTLFVHSSLSLSPHHSELLQRISRVCTALVHHGLYPYTDNMYICSDRTMPERSPTPPRDSSSNSTTNAVTHAHEQLDQLHTTLRDLFDFMLQHAAAERAHIDTINFKNAENAERARRRARPYWWGPFGIILSCLLVTTILGGTILLCAARGRWNISRSTSSSSSSSQIALASSECWIIPVLRASQGCWIATLVLLVPFSFYIWYRWEEQDISDEKAVGVLVILFAMLAYLIGGIQSSNDGLSEAFGSGC